MEQTEYQMKREIHGNISGIRDMVLNEMMLLYDMEMSADEFLSDEVCDALVRLTSLIHREVLIYVSRVGKIEDVRVGKNATAGGQNGMPSPLRYEASRPRCLPTDDPQDFGQITSFALEKHMQFVQVRRSLSLLGP